MQYLRNTRNMKLMIELGDEAKWWVDSSYAVRPDICHTGIYMTLRKGATYTASCKQKLNTISSRKQNCGQRDGTSAMDQTFLSHTRTSYTNNNNIPRQQKHNTTSRKWKIFKFKENMPHKCMHFWSRQDKKGEVKVAFCPTMNMHGDFFKKPLQGSKFKKNAKNHSQYAQH